MACSESADPLVFAAREGDLESAKLLRPTGAVEIDLVPEERPAE